MTFNGPPRDRGEPEIFKFDDVSPAVGQTGIHTTIYRGEGVKTLGKLVNRDGVCGKLFHQPWQPNDTLYTYLWGLPYMPDGQVSTLFEATAIQNILAHHTLAPRVYDIVMWAHKGVYRPMQITQDLGTEYSGDQQAARRVWEQCKETADELGFVMPTPDANPALNVVGYKWVDFNGAKVTAEYEAAARERYEVDTACGPVAYQSFIDAHEGPHKFIRNTNERLQALDLTLPQLGFRPQRVLDIGCSGGQFLNYYESQGARCEGVDLPKVVHSAAEMSYLHGHWNVDYGGIDVTGTRFKDWLSVLLAGRNDLVLCLSVTHRIGGLAANPWIKDMVAPGGRLVVEVADESHKAILHWLGPSFEEVNALWSKDYGRIVVHAERIGNG